MTRLRITPRPRMDEAMTIAQGKAVVLALRTVILALSEAGEIDALEVADLLLADPPIHDEPVAETFARLMMNDLVTQLRDTTSGRGVG